MSNWKSLFLHQNQAAGNVLLGRGWIWRGAGSILGMPLPAPCSQGGAGAPFWTPETLAIRLPPPPPGVSISSFQPRSVYLRPWTEARGEWLVKQPLQRLQGGEGPDDFTGRRGESEGQGLVRTVEAPRLQLEMGSHRFRRRPRSFTEGQVRGKIQACQHRPTPDPLSFWSPISDQTGVVMCRLDLPLFSHTRLYSL